MNELLEMIAVYRKYTGLLEEKINRLEKGAIAPVEKPDAAPPETAKIAGDGFYPPKPPSEVEKSAEKKERKQFVPHDIRPQKIDGKKLNAMRIAKGIKAMEMEKKLGCHPSSINAWEAGKWQPSQETQDKIMLILDCKREDFFAV